MRSMLVFGKATCNLWLNETISCRPQDPPGCLLSLCVVSGHSVVWPSELLCDLCVWVRAWTSRRLLLSTVYACCLCLCACWCMLEMLSFLSAWSVVSAGPLPPTFFFFLLGTRATTGTFALSDSAQLSWGHWIPPWHACFCSETNSITFFLSIWFASSSLPLLPFWFRGCWHVD